jgi:O-antigen ligase
MNSGELGIEMCMFVPISWYFYQAVKPYVKEKWKRGLILMMPFTGIIGAVGSSSRGALLGLVGVAGYGLLRGGGRRLRAAVGAVVLCGLIFIMLPEEQKQRFRESGEDTTSVRRLNYWKKGIEMTRMYPVLGIGYANWVEYYKDKYRVLTFEYVQVSHNIFIQCMAELGLSGLTVFLCLITATFVINNRTRKMSRAGPSTNEFILQMGYALDAALIGYLLSGFFVTVLYYPYFWINLSLSVALNQVAQRRKVELRRMTPAALSALAPQPVPATAARTLPRRSRR